MTKTTSLKRRLHRHTMIEDTSKCNTLILNRLDLSSSDSNSITQSNFHKGEGGVVPDSAKGSSSESKVMSKQS